MVRKARIGGAIVMGAVFLAGCASSQSGHVPAKQPSSTTNASAGSSSSNARLIEAELALQRKHYVQAAQLFCAAADASDDEALAEHATAMAYEHHQNSHVLKCANRWLQINSSNEQARRYAGVAALRLYRIDEAAEHFQVLIESAFISPQAGFMQLAPQWFDEGSRPAVLALMQRLIERHKNLAEAQYVLAQAAVQAENISLALASVQRAAELSPYWAPARSLLARVQLAAGQRDAALATARASLEQDKRIENRIEYAQLQIAAGKEEGLQDLQSLSESSDVGPDVVAVVKRSLAFIDMDRGAFDSASKRWRSLVQSGRFVYEGLFYLGQLAERRGEVPDAIELYSRVAEGDLSLGAQSRAALLKARAGTAADGIAVLRDFAKAHPERDLDMVSAQAALLAELGNVGQSVDVLNAAIAEYPDKDALRVNKALLLERGKRSTEAIKEMRTLVRDRPNDPSALNMLGYTLVDRTRNQKEGLDLIGRALELMPDNGAVLDSMGWALHRQGRNDEALGYLQRSLERARDPDIAVHLGEVLWSLGRKDDARKTWEQAQAAYPDHAELKDIIRKRQNAKP